MLCFSAISSPILKGWPSLLVLKESFFHPALVQRLNNGEPMVKSDKSKILNGIYDYVTTLVLYPSPMQYAEMAMAVLKKWPVTAQNLPIDQANVSVISFFKCLSTWWSQSCLILNFYPKTVICPEMQKCPVIFTNYFIKTIFTVF